MRMGSGLDVTAKTAGDPRDRVASRCLAFLKDVLGNFHPRDFRIRLWDGSAWDAEPGEPSRFTFVLRNPGGFRAMFRSPSEITLGEAYLDGDIEVEGDLGEAFRLSDRLVRMRPGFDVRLRCARLLLSLPSTGRSRPVRPAMRLHGSLHSRERDRQAVTYHYDLSNDFYALWLDERMVYSCAYFADPAEDLHAAQERKLHYICRKLRLRPGDRLLDIGCGWGAMVLCAAERYGAEAHGVTLSGPQAEWANERIREAGLSGRCRVDLRDYREIDAWERYDKLVSVGMFEHVGEVRMREYFERAYRLLRPGGVFLNHGIACHSGIPSQPGPSFSDNYIFPDGELLPIATTLRAAEACGFEVRDVESLREHYVLTLRHWLRRLEERRTEARRFVDERTFRLWKLYLAGASHTFLAGRNAVFQVLLVKPFHGESGLPLTRTDWYDPGTTA